MKREEMEKLIEPYETRSNLFPTHAELMIHMVAGDMQEICRLARLGASAAEPTPTEIEAVAIALAEKSNGTSWSLLHISWREIYRDLARAALLTLKETHNG